MRSRRIVCGYVRDQTCVIYVIKTIEIWQRCNTASTRPQTDACLCGLKLMRVYGCTISALCIIRFYSRCNITNSGCPLQLIECNCLSFILELHPYCDAVELQTKSPDFDPTMSQLKSSEVRFCTSETFAFNFTNLLSTRGLWL